MSTLKNNIGILVGAVIVAAFIVAAVISFSPTFAAQTSDKATNIDGRFKTFNFFTATTTTATSTTADPLGMDILGAKKVNLYFSRSGPAGNVGFSRYKIQVATTTEGVIDWYDYSRMFLFDVSQTATSTVTVSGTSTTPVAVDIEDNGFSRLRVIVDEITDGSHSAAGTAEF